MESDYNPHFKTSIRTSNLVQELLTEHHVKYIKYSEIKQCNTLNS